MTLMIDRIAGLTTAYPIVIGVLLVIINLWFPKGILGSLRDRWIPWMK